MSPRTGRGANFLVAATFGFSCRWNVKEAIQNAYPSVFATHRSFDPAMIHERKRAVIGFVSGQIVPGRVCQGLVDRVRFRQSELIRKATERVTSHPVLRVPVAQPQEQIISFPPASE